MAIIGRYSTIDKAIIITTGNSLVLCGDTNEISINTSDMITPSGGATRDYTLAGSSAKLNILDNSTILYAELVWLSTVISTADGALNISSIQDNPITFITPEETISLSPSYTDSYISPTGTVDRLRATDVTNLIKNSLSGTYTVSNVPTSIPSIGLSDSRAGWALTVIYRNPSFKPNRIVYSVGLDAATLTNPIQASFTGFKTDGNNDDLKGSLISVFANGNPLDDTDILKLGPSVANLTIVGNSVGVPNKNPGTTPNNPWNSFSSGQINIADTLNSSKGLIDISGTKGTVNHNAFVPTQVVGARNKWDITCVDISNTLGENQTQLAGQYTINNPTGAIELIVLGAQINSDSPNITSTLTSYDIDGDDQYNINLGERLIYMVQIKNSGNTAATNINLSTTLDPTLQFVSNSLTLNGTTQTGADITKGVNIGSIDPSGVVNVGFTVKAVSLVSGDGTADTTVNYNYSFISGSGSPTYTNYDKTNTIHLIIQDGSLNVVKKVSSTTAKLGDTLVYTTEITNTGSEPLFNIMFQDKINKYCSFVSGSVQIDNVPYGTYNPNTGFSLSKLAQNTKTVITFSVKVNSLSPNTIIENGALVTFSYIFNQYLVPITKTTLSNTTSLQIQFTEIMAQRNADNYYPNIGDTVTCSLALSNVGNISSSNVQVIEPPIPGCTFVDGSVYINGIRKLGYNPFTGFTLDSIDPQTTTNITYQILVNQIQPNQIVQNIAKVPFKYQISSDTPVISSEKDSNKVTTRSNKVVMSITETVDKAYGTINDILYYSVNVTNTGNINAINTTFLSTVQTESTFIANTVAINGLIQQDYDPNTGFSLGTIAPENTINVTFQVKINSVPTPNVINNISQLVYGYKPDPNKGAITNTITSNTVQTIINVAKFSFAKSVDKAYAVTGDYIVYKCIIANSGTVNLTNIYFSDEISTYVKFLPNSVYLGGVNYPDYNPNDGFSIDPITPSESIELLFGVQVITAPPFGFVMNVGSLTYTYKVNPDSPVITETRKTNEVQTKVVNGNLTLTKYASISYATIGDKITYSFDISNTGNTTVSNGFFFDKIPPCLSFNKGSVTINGTKKADYDPTIGFNIGSLNVGQVVQISFDSAVNSIPSPNTIANNGSATYSYFIDPNMPAVSKTSTSNTVTTVINKASAQLTKAVDKAYVTINDVITYTITATNTGTTTLTNNFFTDLIPSGAAFISRSVVIDNVNYSSYDPNRGFKLDALLPSSSTVISFKATITSTPPKVDNSAHMTYKYKINPTGDEYSSSVTSNTVTTNINTIIISNTKTVDKSYAEVTNTLTYTSVIKNTGNISITDTKFVDIIASEAAFVEKSVTINNQTYEDYNPNTGFTLGTIGTNETKTVSFQVTVSTVPATGYINNKSTLYYNYKINPADPNTLGTIDSNTVTTYIKSGTLTITKTADRAYSRLQDTIQYSFLITNTGNTALSNLRFQDTIQSDSSFNSGSVYINGAQQSGLNPNSGFSLSDLGVGKYTTITFIVTVNSLPGDGKLYNTGNVNYSYYVDPASTIVTKNVVSNQTTVAINQAIVSASKLVDKSIAKVGDSLKFTINISNKGNVPAQFITFTDLLVNNLTFDKGSVTIGGESKSDFDPNQSFPIPDISGNTTTTVTFTATINSRPSNNIITNFANIDYKYRINTTDPYTDISINTNTTTTYVAVGELTLNKAVDKAFATVDDTLTYTVNVKNTGSVNAANLLFKDLNPNNATFIPKTVVVDGTKNEAFDPNSGFSLSDLIPNQSHTVSFSVKVDSLPDSGQIANTAHTTFNYQLLVTEPIQQVTADSNTVTTNINLGKLTLTKSVDNAYATINDTLNYTINIKNIGNSTCKSILFQDIIQVQAAFVPQSIKINDTPKPDYDPNTGFNLDDIGKSGSVKITFAVTVNSLPKDYIIINTGVVNYKYNINPNNEPISLTASSNTVTTNINVGMLNVTKETNKAYVTIDDIVSYTVTIVNAGNVDANFVNFRDIIPLGLTFVANSVKINDQSKPGFDPYQSFTLGNIASSNSVLVKFDTKVTSVPTPSLVTNKANIVFSYKIDPSTDYIVKQTDSNPVTTQINLGKLSLTKTVNKAYATLKDQLTYTVTITNTGNIDATNVIFTDGIQSDASFVTGSVTVNGNKKDSYDPQVGFNLGTIAALDSVTVTFSVTVKTLPIEYILLNTADAAFSYKINPTGETYTKSVTSDTASTIIIVPGLSISEIVNLAYATIGAILEYSVTIKNTGNTTDKALFFIDTLTKEASFVPDSVIINNQPNPNVNPIDGFNLGDLFSGHTTVISFKAKVTALPSPPQVTSYGKVNGLYNIDPAGTDYKIDATSNIVSTQINVGNLSNVKTVDKMYAKVSDSLTYTSVITNIGNVTALNTLFTDNLQTEAQFITGTVVIDSMTYPALDPTKGFTLGDLIPNKSVQVSFNVKIASLPVPPQIVNKSQTDFTYIIDPNGNSFKKSIISNNVVTNVVNGTLSLTKTVDKTIATINDELVFNIRITNPGNVAATEVWFQDTPSTGAVFKPGSVIVNNTPMTALDPTAGFSLDTIAIGNVSTVQFTAQVKSTPPTNQVTNQAVTNFKFLVNPAEKPVTDTAYSNVTTTNIAIGNLNVIKSVDKQFATIGQTLTYTVVIENTGNINITNGVFLDPTPDNTNFIIGSVTVNGENKPNYNPSAGFDLDTMKPGEIITVVYQVEVV